MARPLGVRLTCPLCRDSSFFSLQEVEAAGGKVMCDNHPNWIEMVDLATLMEINGVKVVVIEDEIDFESEDMTVLHPDDVDFRLEFSQ